MPRWTRAQVEQFAPDDRSIAAAKKLARPGPWSETGATDTLVWGKCQGSGKTPYQVSVDLTGPASKCTCPSRKFPCKHGIALLMLWVAGDGEVGDMANPADFAGEWAADRAARSTARAAKADAPPDPEAQAKRLANRLELMDAGVRDFERWLGDLVRKGIAQARQQPYSYWEAPAARLTDAQLPGLAQRVRDTPGMLHGPDWADRVLVEIGRWFLSVRSWLRRAELSDDDMGNLRSFLGWPYATDDIRSGRAIEDAWLVEGVHRSFDGRLEAQRSWLRGETSGERFVVLDFAAGGATLQTSQIAGAIVEAKLAPYPGSGVRRALFCAPPRVDHLATALPSAGTVEAAFGNAAQLAGENPFIERTPATLLATVRACDGSGELVDTCGRALPLAPDFDPWHLMALTGPHPMPVFGELNAGMFLPLTVAADDGLVAL